MRRIVFLICMALLMGPSFPSTAGACGQKFLVASRGGPFAAFEQASSPAAILIYRSHDVATTAALWDPELESTLEEVGHSVELTEDREQLLTILRDRRFDIVMMDVADARELGKEVSSVSPGTVVLPALVFPSRAEYSRTKREYGVALKTPTTAQTLLAVIARAGSSAPK